MRKLMMAVMAVAGLGLTVGCQDRNKVQEEQRDVAEAQRDVAKERQEVNREVAETRQDGQEELTDAEKNLMEEQRELADAQHKQLDEQNDRATGGSGTATTRDTTANVKTEEVKGTIQSTSANTIALIVPDKNNQVMRFQANPQVQVMKDDKPVALKDLKPGDEVRASYQLDPNGQMILKSIDVKKMSAQHPEQPKK
jgi:phage host-nuclease inhibitor protein Gam